MDGRGLCSIKMQRAWGGVQLRIKGLNGREGTMTLKMVQKHGEGGSIESLRAEWRGGDYDTKNGAKAWRGGFNGELKDWMEGGG